MLLDSNLNLTRKWRSKNFDQVVGQELSIRMLKNSLYRDQLFPVYLFSGQRGCGKTTTARIFAAAVNCDGLLQFQQNPKSTVIPCLVCASCVAMSMGQHPDFSEIDAASHTGIDTIRQLIDSAQLLPIMGRKKIYLIDEAHMLSKASFNALLKILEEPPRSVLFILATTDVHKIIDTVRSRCFQLFFGPIVQDQMYKHLATICLQEEIHADEQALHLIATQSDGSLRDALNLLEQVRFSSAKITKQAVLLMLGYLDDELLVQLFETLCLKSSHEFLVYIQKIRLESYAPERIWERLIVAVRALLWVKNGLKPQQLGQYEARLKHLILVCPWSFWVELSEKLHAYQLLFNRTSAKYSLLEMILLQACHNRTTSGTNGAAAQVAPGSEVSSLQDTLHNENDAQEEDDQDDQNNEFSAEKIKTLWSLFVKDMDQLGDPVVKSIFQRGNCLSYKNNELVVQLSKQFIFFHDSIVETRNAWNPLFQALFGQQAVLKIVFDADAVEPLKKEVVAPSTQKKSYKQTQMCEILQNSQKWPLATLLVQYFPGTFTEISENNHV